MTYTVYLLINCLGSTAVADMADACGADSPMVITAQNSTDISSPNFPENYPNNMNCTWLIVAHNNATIELSLKGYETEREYEF